MSITSDEVNFLVYRYLQENGFSHSAFTFAYESLVVKSSVSQTEIPPGALITFLQKGLEYIAIEEHINEDGTIQEFDDNYTLLSPIICEAIAFKDDRRVRRFQPSSNLIPVEEQSNTVPPETLPEDDIVKMEVSNPEIEPSNASSAQIIEQDDTKMLKLIGHQMDISKVGWNPIVHQLATGSADGSCKLWNVWEILPEKWNSSANSSFSVKASILPNCQQIGESNKDVTVLAWSPDGQFIATACIDGLARIWDRSGDLKFLLKAHGGAVYTLKWSPNGKYLLSGSFDKQAIVWDGQTGNIIKTYLSHTNSLLDVDWKDNDIFATSSIDPIIHVFQLSNELQPQCTFSGHESDVNAISWSPGGDFLASCSDDTTVKIWVMEDGLKHNLVGHINQAVHIQWTPTGKGSPNEDKALYLCSSSLHETFKIWNPFSGELVFSLNSPKLQEISTIHPSPNGEMIATGSFGGTLSIWTIATGTLLKEWTDEFDIYDVSWNKDGSMLCSCGTSGIINIIDTKEYSFPSE